MKNIIKALGPVALLLSPEAAIAGEPTVMEPTPSLTTEELATAVGNGQPEMYAGGEAPVDDGATVDLDDVPDMGRVYLPQTFYTLVCTKADYAISKSSQKPMITFEWEVVAPAQIRHKNVDVNIEGTTVTEFVSLQPQALGKVKALHRTLELPMKGFNAKNPKTTVYLGLAMSAVVKTNQKVLAKEGTNEPLIDPVTKQPLATNEYRIERYGVRAAEFDRSIPY